MSDAMTRAWLGYARKNGKKGIRNRVLVVYTVKCAEHVARQIVAEARDGDVELVGFDGCTDNQYAVNQLISLIRHPNVGAVLAVGLGCEYTQPEWLAKIAADEGKPADWFFIQDAGGTAKAISRGVAWVRDALEALQQVPRVEMTFADLVIGAECGGSDYTSGLAGNIVVGRFFDRLVDAGGTAIFEEIVEAVGLDWFLTSRAVDVRVKAELQHTYDKALDYCRHARQYSISPGNFAGGLSTIEEKSMGAVVKSGTRPIQGVLKVSAFPSRPGLWLLDSTPDPYFMDFGITNPSDNEGLTDLTASGAHIVFLVTGRGNVVGNAIAPCVKVTGTAETYARMIDDMDFNAGTTLEGAETMDACAERLADMVADIAEGAPSKSEALGHREFHIIYKYQDKAGCRMEEE